MKNVVIVHPDMPGVEVEVFEDSLWHHQRAGWDVKSAKGAKPVANSKPAGGTGGQEKEEK